MILWDGTCIQVEATKLFGPGCIVTICLSSRSATFFGIATSRDFDCNTSHTSTEFGAVLDKEFMEVASSRGARVDELKAV